MEDHEQAKTAQLLAMMFNSFPQSAVADVDAQMEAYVFCLEEFYFEDVAQAIRRVMQGGEGHENRTYAPSTAELCQEVKRRAEMRLIMADRAKRAELTSISGGKK